LTKKDTEGLELKFADPNARILKCYGKAWKKLPKKLPKTSQTHIFTITVDFP